MAVNPEHLLTFETAQPGSNLAFRTPRVTRVAAPPPRSHQDTSETIEVVLGEDAVSVVPDVPIQEGAGAPATPVQEETPTPTPTPVQEETPTPTPVQEETPTPTPVKEETPTPTPVQEETDTASKKGKKKKKNASPSKTVEVLDIGA